jgi:CheY-like chemotaxis protein
MLVRPHDSETQVCRDGSSRPGSESHLRILLIEDHEDTRDALALLLEMEGHEVFAAQDGPEALADGVRFGPDVVITDFDMPRMDGAEVARQVRRFENRIGHVPILVLSALNRPLVERAMEAGADAHIAKPVDFEKLNAMLSRIARGAFVARRNRVPSGGARRGDPGEMSH